MAMPAQMDAVAAAQIRFRTGKTRTMDAGLLSSAHPNGLSIHDITNGVRLGKLERNPCNEHIAHSRLWEILALCNDIRKIIASHRAVITALFHVHAENLTELGDLWFVSRIHLKYGIVALLLFLQDL